MTSQALPTGGATRSALAFRGGPLSARGEPNGAARHPERFSDIDVFSATFGERLSAGERQRHLAATFLIAVAVALIMTPAAYHRQTGPREVTETFVRLSTRLLLWSMWPLAIGVCLHFYIDGRAILHNVVAPVLAGVLFAIFVGLWFLLPLIRGSRGAGR
jgi:hypothetical protein